MATRTVGSGKTYATLAAAIAASSSGDRIEVYPGIYTDDFVAINVNLTIVGIGQMPQFVGTIDIPNGKGMIVVNANVSIEYLELSGARIANAGGANAAAIRLETGTLSVTDSWIHGCQNGILTNGNTAGAVTLLRCEVNDCGVSDPALTAGYGQTHGIYIGSNNPGITVTGCFFHDNHIGHHIKSIALQTSISGTRIFDNTTPSSLSIQAGQGGIVAVQNCIMQKANVAQNPNMVVMGGQGTSPSNNYQIIGNTFVNNYANPVGVNNLTVTTATLTTNSFWGITSGQVASGPNTQSGNIFLGASPTLDQTHPFLSPSSSTPSVRRIVGYPRKRPTMPIASAAGAGTVTAFGAKLAAALAAASGSAAIAGSSQTQIVRSGVGSAAGVAVVTAPTGSASSVIATVVVQNQSAGPSPAETYVSFGLPVGEGIVPVGSRLRFELLDGTVLRSQVDSRNSWPTDGSLRLCEPACVLPSIAPSGSLTVRAIKEVGAWDNATTRNVNEVRAASDLKMAISNVRDFADYAVVSQVVTSTNRLVINSGYPGTFNIGFWPSGSPVQFDTTVGTITAGTTYYVTFIAGNTYTLHTTQADAIANTNLIVLPASGLVGTHLNKLTVTRGSGAFTCSFNTVPTPNIDVVKSGAACVQYRGHDFFKDDVGGAADAHLETEFYVTAWTKNDGTLGPISHIPKVHQGWMNIPDGIWCNYDALYKNGNTTIRDFYKEWTVTAIDLATNILTVPGHGFVSSSVSAMDCQIKSDGILPAPLFANMIYGVQVIDASHVKLYDCAVHATGGQLGTPIDLTTIGSGTVKIYRSIFHSTKTSWFGCDTDGLLDWTVSDPNIFIKHDKKYLISTQVFPPYNTTRALSPADDPAPRDYSPQWCPDMRLAIDGTGPSQHISVMPDWCARDLLGQAPGYRRTARVNALSMGSMACQTLNEATHKIPTLIGTGIRGAAGNFPGMGTSKQNAVWSSSGFTADFKQNFGPISNAFGPILGSGSTHYPQMIYSVYIQEGGVHLLDLQLTHANGVLISYSIGQTIDALPSRIQRVYPESANIYYGVILRNPVSPRNDGWCAEVLATTSLMIPDNRDEAAYFHALVDNNCDLAAEIIASAPQAVRDMGHWSFTNLDLTSPWMHNYCAVGAAYSYLVRRKANGFTFATHMVKQTYGYASGTLFPCPLSVGAYRASTKKVYHDSTLPGYPGNHVDQDSIDNWADMGYCGYSVNIAAATDILTVFQTSSVNKVTTPITLGDKIAFCYSNQNLGFQALPTPLVAHVWYYAVPVTSSTIKISATPDGSNIVDITQNANGIAIINQCQVCPTDLIDHALGSSIIASLASLCFANAIGVPGISGAIDNLEVYNYGDFFAPQSDGVPHSAWALLRSYPTYP